MAAGPSHSSEASQPPLAWACHPEPGLAWTRLPATGTLLIRAWEPVTTRAVGLAVAGTGASGPGWIGATGDRSLGSTGASSCSDTGGELESPLQGGHRGTWPPPTLLLLLKQKQHYFPESPTWLQVHGDTGRATAPLAGLDGTRAWVVHSAGHESSPQVPGLSFLHGVGRKSSSQDSCSKKSFKMRKAARSRGPGWGRALPAARLPARRSPRQAALRLPILWHSPQPLPLPPRYPSMQQPLL